MGKSEMLEIIRKAGLLLREHRLFLDNDYMPGLYSNAILKDEKFQMALITEIGNIITSIKQACNYIVDTNDDIGALKIVELEDDVKALLHCNKSDFTSDNRLKYFMAITPLVNNIRFVKTFFKEYCNKELKSGNITLPSELDTERAKALLQSAIQNKLCDNNYKWLKTKSLLAYFADKASEYLNLDKGEYDGKAKTSWKPFETLFNIKGLSGAKNDYQKTGTLPDGYKKVDELFE